jgi:hypothetical protein
LHHHCRLVIRFGSADDPACAKQVVLPAAVPEQRFCTIRIVSLRTDFHSVAGRFPSGLLPPLEKNVGIERSP